MRNKRISARSLLGWLIFGMGFAVTGFLAVYTAMQGLMGLPPLGENDLNDWFLVAIAILHIGIGATIGFAMLGGYTLAVQQLIKRQFGLLVAELGAGIVLACVSMLYKVDRYWSCAAQDSSSLLGLGWPLPMIKLAGLCDFEAYFYVGLNILFWSAFAASVYYIYREYRK